MQISIVHARIEDSCVNLKIVLKERKEEEVVLNLKSEGCTVVQGHGLVSYITNANEIVRSSQFFCLYIFCFSIELLTTFLSLISQSQNEARWISHCQVSKSKIRAKSIQAHSRQNSRVVQHCSSRKVNFGQYLW